MKERLEFIEKIREKILARKDELQKQVSLQSKEKVTDGGVSDTADEALALTMEKLQNSLQKSEIDELNLIDLALDRIKKGEYGICIDCGEPISVKRLEHYPYAARCIICQEAVEG
ncbi:MAG: TraR/DksA family transcriptional regulator [bacterium]